jgi:hypothetical protein
MYHITRDDLTRRFSHHPPPNSETALAHEQVRELLLEAADKIVLITGAPSREQSSAITHLEQAMMWANADIARKGADSKASSLL